MDLPLQKTHPSQSQQPPAYLLKGNHPAQVLKYISTFNLFYYINSLKKILAAASTPVSKRNVTPGTSFKTPDLNRSNSVSQKRKIFTTPTTSKHPDTPIPKKTATATNQSLHLSTVETDEECNVAVAVRVRPLNSK